MKRSRPYIIIGAGPAGLAAAKVFKERGIDFIGLEAHSNAGGMWDRTNSNSVIYKSAHLISSKERSQFKDYPMPKEWPDFLPHRLVNEYLQGYAKEFDLNKHYHFDCLVKNAIRREHGGWLVETNQGNFDAEGLVLASGMYKRPNMPEIKGEFSGEILHSKSYKEPSLFKDKRVLIVGLGNSACDMAVDAIAFASKVDVSIRGSNHFVPKLIMGRPADHLDSRLFPSQISRHLNSLFLKVVVGSHEKYGLPRPDFKFLDKHPIMNSLFLYHLRHGDITIRPEMIESNGHTVCFKDQSESDYDIIMMATGYKPGFPYVDDAYLNIKNEVPDFHLNIFHPELNDIFIIGMVESNGIGWEGRSMQAGLVADFIHHGKENMPQKVFAETKNLYSKDKRTCKNPIFVNRDLYAKDLNRLSALLNKRAPCEA